MNEKRYCGFTEAVITLNAWRDQQSLLGEVGWVEKGLIFLTPLCSFPFVAIQQFGGCEWWVIDKIFKMQCVRNTEREAPRSPSWMRQSGMPLGENVIWYGSCQRNRCLSKVSEEEKSKETVCVTYSCVSRALVPIILYGYLYHRRVEVFWASISNIGLFVNLKNVLFYNAHCNTATK